MKRTLIILLLVGIALAVLVPTALAQTNYYVDVGAGDDGNTGLAGFPWKTITHAANTVPAGTQGAPNTINVAAGIYSGSETFPITFSNNYVECIGAGAATTIIDGNGTATIIDILATGVRVQNFTIRDATTGIASSEGGFAIVDNVFSGSPAFDVVKGISWVINETSSSDRTIEDTLISGNQFNVSCDGIFMDVVLNGNSSTASIDIGDIDIVNNVFQDGPGATPDTEEGIEADNLSVLFLNGGILSVGTFNISNNEFYDQQHAIDFYGSFDNMTDTTVNVGNFIVSGNTLVGQANSSAMYIDYYDCGYWYGTSMGTLGDLIITNNTVTAGNSWGIDVDDIGYWWEFYDSASLTVGNTIIEGNSVDVGGTGISVSLYEYSYLNDNSQLTTGDLIISSGTVVAGADGIYIYFYDLAYETYGDAICTIGDISIDNNSITAQSQGIYFDYNDTAYDMYGNSTCTIGDTYVEDNSIDSQDEAIYFYVEDIAVYNENNSSFYMGDCYIRNNSQILANDYGIYFYYYDYYVGAGNYDNAYSELPSYIITGNTFDTEWDGIYFYTYSNPDDTYGSSVVDYGGLFIDNNVFNSGTYTMDDGVYLYYDDFCEGCYDSSGAIVQDITISNNQFTGLSGDAVEIWLGDFAYSFDNNGFAELGDMNISGNTIDGASRGVVVDHDYIFAEYNGITTIGDLDIIANTLSNVSDTGVWLDYYMDTDETSRIKVGRTLVQGNTLNGAGRGDGIYIEDIVIDNAPGAALNFGGVVIDGNYIDGWSSGIYLNSGNGVSMVSNIIQNNVDGIWMQKSGNNFVLGNNIASNGGAVAPSGVHVNDGAGNQAHFNSITGNNTHGVFSGSQTVNAELNWWGDDSGPFDDNAGTTECAPVGAGGWNCDTCDQNNDGAGDRVSNLLVDYCPWIMAGDMEPGTPSCHYIEGNGMIRAAASFTGGTMTIAATGGHTLCTLNYGTNPAGPVTFDSYGHFWDVYLDKTRGVSNVMGMFGPIDGSSGGGGPQPTPTPSPSPSPSPSPLPNSLQISTAPAAIAGAVSSGTQIAIYYWDGSAWKLCSNQTVVGEYVQVTINNSTKPNLSDLTGQIFADGLRLIQQAGGGGPTVGGEVMLVNKAALLTQQIALPIRLMLSTVF